MKLFVVALVALSMLTDCSDSEKESTVEVAVYFVGDTPEGFKLFSEKVEYSEDVDLTTAVISDLVSGVLTPRNPDYLNLWNSSTQLIGIELGSSTATVNLDLGQLNVGSEGEQRAIDQVVWTLTEVLPRIKRVNFEVSGKIVESFAGHVDTTQSFGRDSNVIGEARP